MEIAGSGESVVQRTFVNPGFNPIDLIVIQSLSCRGHLRDCPAVQNLNEEAVLPLAGNDELRLIAHEVGVHGRSEIQCVRRAMTTGAFLREQRLDVLTETHSG